MIGTSVQPRRPAMTSTPSMSGRPRSRTTASGGRARRPRASAARAVGGERRPRSRAPRRLIASARRRPGSSSTTRTRRHRRRVAAERRAEADPHRQARRRGVSSATIAPPIASTNPRATARPSPTPPPASRSSRRWNGSKSALALLGRDARARGRRSRASRSRRRRSALRPRPAPSPPWRSALSSRLASTRSSRPAVGLDERQVLGHVDRDARRRRPAAPGRAAATTSSSATGSGCDGQRAGLQPAGVEQVARRRRRGGRRTPRSSPAARRARRRTSRRRSGAAADRGLDPGQRRAQVVADRGQQRRALAVDRRRAPARLARLLAEPAALVGGLRPRAANACSTRWSSANSAGPRPTQPQVAADRHVEAQRRLVAGRRPADVLDVDPLVRRRGRAPAARRTPCEGVARLARGRRAGVSAPRGRRRPAPRASRPARGACSAARARRAASSTAPLTDRRDGDEHDERDGLVARGRRRACGRGVDEEVVDQQRRGDRGERRATTTPPTERDDDDRQQVEQHLAVERQLSRVRSSSSVSSGSADDGERQRRSSWRRRLSPSRAGRARAGPARRAGPRCARSSTRADAHRRGSSSGAEHPRDARDRDRRLEQQPALEPQRGLVVQQVLPPVRDHVLRDDDRDHVARVLAAQLAHVADAPAGPSRGRATRSPPAAPGRRAPPTRPASGSSASLGRRR